MEEKRKVLVLAPCGEERKAALLERFGDRCDFSFKQDRASAIGQTEIIIGAPREAELEQAQKLRWLQLSWAGVDEYARMAHFPKDILFTNVSGAFGTVISEYVVGGIVAQYRGFGIYRDQQRQHVWKRLDESATVAGKKVLILGMGDLGSNVAQRLAAFGAHPAGVRRKKHAELPAGFETACTMEQLDEMLGGTDVLVNCLPETKQTCGLLTRERLMMLKKGALFVNVGRGSVVCNDDLVFALEEKHLRGAVLDVMEKEPLPAQSKLWDMENVLLTPHIAGPSYTANEDVLGTIWEICLDNLARYLAGEPLRHVVNLEAGY